MYCPELHRWHAYNELLPLRPKSATCNAHCYKEWCHAIHYVYVFPIPTMLYYLCLDLTPPLCLEGIPKLRYSYTNPVHLSPTSVTLRQIILNGQIFGIWVRWMGQWLNSFLQSSASTTWFSQLWRVLLCHSNLLAINRGQLYLPLWRLPPSTTPAPTVVYCLLTALPVN